LAMPLIFGGCFKSPTSPTSFSSMTGSGSSSGGVATATPTGGGTHATATPTPVTGGGGGTGSISGTITGSTGLAVTIAAYNGTSGPYQTTITGDGSYTITGVPDGSFYVHAWTAGYGHSGVYTGNGGTVTVSGGGAVTGINITLY
jgi:hypothetical protein